MREGEVWAERRTGSLAAWYSVFSCAAAKRRVVCIRDTRIMHEQWIVEAKKRMTADSLVVRGIRAWETGVMVVE